jgi:diguanylate cyclase (GGDEF)-like protein
MLELAAADFAILIEPTNGAGPKVSAASGHASDSCYAELAEDPRAQASLSSNRETLIDRLKHLSRHDELTGLLNRRVLTEELDRQVAAAARHDRPLSLVMLDLDRFKDYNDTRGHQAGDLLLKSAAAAWTETLRQSDTMVRYGGEEFVAVMPDCTLEAAVIAAERLRAALPAGTTCSAGVASLGHSESWADLIARADQALYQAKTAGRNRTCANDPTYAASRRDRRVAPAKTRATQYGAT